MVAWKNESRKLYATKVRKKKCYWSYNEKKSTGEHCDDWKDHWQKQQNLAEVDDVGGSKMAAWRISSIEFIQNITISEERWTKTPFSFGKHMMMPVVTIYSGALFS